MRFVGFGGLGLLGLDVGKMFKLFWGLDHRCPTSRFMTGGMNTKKSSDRAAVKTGVLADCHQGNRNFDRIYRMGRMGTGTLTGGRGGFHTGTVGTGMGD